MRSNIQTREVTHGAIQLQPQREVLHLARVVHSEACLVEVVQVINKALGVGSALCDFAAKVGRSHLRQYNVDHMNRRLNNTW